MKQCDWSVGELLFYLEPIAHDDRFLSAAGFILSARRTGRQVSKCCRLICTSATAVKISGASFKPNGMAMSTYTLFSPGGGLIHLPFLRQSQLALRNWVRPPHMSCKHA